MKKDKQQILAKIIDWDERVAFMGLPKDWESDMLEQIYKL